MMHLAAMGRFSQRLRDRHIHAELRFPWRYSQAILAALAASLLGVSTPIAAAPLPPGKPVSPCGTVRQIRWLPPKTLPAVPSMSGSARHERHWPARAVVVLGEVQGISGEKKRQINALLATSEDGVGISLKPGQLLLVLADVPFASLRPPARICVTDFVIIGDEGGTWTRHGELRVVRRESHKNDRH